MNTISRHATRLCLLALLIIQPARAAAHDTNERLSEIFYHTLDSTLLSISMYDNTWTRHWSIINATAICDSDSYYGYQCAKTFVLPAASLTPEYLQTAHRALRRFGNPQSITTLKLKAAALGAIGAYNSKMLTDTASTYFAQAAALMRQANESKLEMLYRIWRAEALIRENDLPAALDEAHYMMRTFASIITPNVRFAIEMQMLKAYIKMMDTYRAAEMVNNIERTPESSRTLIMNARFMIEKCALCILNGNYAQAFEISALLEKATDVMPPTDRWKALAQRAILLERTNSLGQAEAIIQNLNKTPRFSRYIERNSEYSRNNVLMLETSIALKRRQYSKAEQLLQKIDSTCLRTTFTNTYYFELMEDVLVASGKYQQAIDMLDRKSRTIDSIMRANARMRARNLENTFNNDTTIIGQKTLLLNKEQYATRMRQRAITWFAVSILAFMTASLIIALYIRRKRKQKVMLRMEHQSNLELEVYRQTLELREQKNQIAAKNADILKSIAYAKHIQHGILQTPDELRHEGIKASFVHFAPIATVSGDLYWFRAVGDKMIVCCADCSGHGVPGAMMSMVVVTLINDIASTAANIDSPSAILEEIDAQMMESMPDTDINDSIEMSVAIIDTKESTVSISAARRDTVAIVDGVPNIIKGNRRRIGFRRPDHEPFADTTINIAPDDSLYLFTDGVTNMFGGANNEKLKINRFADILADANRKQHTQREAHIKHALAQWRHEQPQNDDILIIGIDF